MPWSRGSLLAALLALPASFVFADTVKVSGSCALPDAVAYLYLPAEAASGSDRRSPLNGCMREEDEASETHVVQLTSGATYTVASEIAINTSLTIKGAEGEEVRPVINVTSTGINGRAFRIEVPVPELTDTTSTKLQLAATLASDGGVAIGDHHTPNNRPTFQGNSTWSNVYLCRQETTDTTTEWLTVGTGAVATDGSWQISPGGGLPVGVNTLGVADNVDCANVETDSIQVSVYDQLLVAFNDVNIERVDCGASCAADGGIFFTSELLSLNSMKIANGKATSRGGAIFVAGQGGLLLDGVELSKNAAPQGAAVYSLYNSFSAQNSLVTENVGSTIVQIDNAAGASGSLLSTIVNSTFSGNDGLALSMREGAILNAMTIVGNTLGGIDFHSEDVEVHNSIVAGNGTADCVGLSYVAPVPATGTTAAIQESPVFKFNLTGAGTGCSASVNAANSYSKELTGTLMATVAADGQVVTDGLLMPLADNGGLLRTHLPRLRIGEVLTRSSPLASQIINQGYLSVLPGTATALACPSTDQREKSRNGFCDIGAVEVQLLMGTTFSGGQFESTGPSQTFSLREDIGDEELLPSARCAEVSSSNGSPVTAAQGCPWLLTEPTKGRVTFNADGTYTYTPFSEFHGFDEFVIQVTTTASILNEGTDPLVKSRSVKASVFMDPDGTVTSQSLLDGGAMDWWFLMLGGLMLGGRIRWSK